MSTNQLVQCELCDEQTGELDSAAIHLMDAHSWPFDSARLWLLGEIEKVA